MTGYRIHILRSTSNPNRYKAGYFGERVGREEDDRASEMDHSSVGAAKFGPFEKYAIDGVVYRLEEAAKAARDKLVSDLTAQSGSIVAGADTVLDFPPNVFPTF